MEEKILLQSQHYNMKKLVIAAYIIALLIVIMFATIIPLGNYITHDEMYYNNRFPECQHTKGGMDTSDMPINGYSRIYAPPYSTGYAPANKAKTRAEFENFHPDVFSFMECRGQGLLLSLLHGINQGVIYASATFLVFTLLYAWLSKYELTVTDKRVYGKAAFGKRVDLPLDSISAVGTSWLKGLDIGTSSGKIHFKLVKNQKVIHDTMSKLLIERQEIAKKYKTKESRFVNSTADELKKYKELLDSGAITQEEFDKIKQQLLGL